MDTTLHYIGANGNDVDLFRNDYFELTNADGLTGVSSDISSSTTPSMDGDKVNNVRTQPRGIVLDLRVKKGVDVEEAKRYILRTIKPKQKGRLVFTQRGRAIDITGVVEAISMPRFGRGVVMQVSLYCSSPYWQDVENVLVEISRAISLHYFPIDENGLAFPSDGIPFGEYDLNMTQTYTNDGDTDCGMVISIIAIGDVTNPVIYKSDGSYIGVNDSLVAGDELIINTNRGEKRITKNGTSVLNKIKSGSSFIQLDTGNNELTINSDSGQGNMYFAITFKRRFV